MQLDKTIPLLLEANVYQLRLYNGRNCTFIGFVDGQKSFCLDAFGSHLVETISAPDSGEELLVRIEWIQTVVVRNECDHVPTVVAHLRRAVSTSLFLTDDGWHQFEDNPRKAVTGNSKLRILSSGAIDGPMQLRIVDRRTNKAIISTRIKGGLSDQMELIPSEYEICVNDKCGQSELKLKWGEVSTLIWHPEDGAAVPHRIRLAQPNAIHVIWQFPQYFTLALGSSMYNVVGLMFTYTESPVSMKSVAQSIWLFTIGLGNVIDAIVVCAHVVDSQANEFFLFAIMMSIDLGVFVLLAKRYRSVHS